MDRAVGVEQRTRHDYTRHLGPSTLVALLRRLACIARLNKDNDTTIYGLGRMSTKSFFLHHIAAISSAIVLADAHTLVTEATHLSVHLTTTAPPPPPPARARAAQASPPPLATE